MEQKESNYIKLRMFFSVDVKNSVKLKGEDPEFYFRLLSKLGIVPHQRDGAGKTKPLEEPYLFSYMDYGNEVINLTERFRERVKKTGNPLPEVWKYLGDEIIYTLEIPTKVTLGTLETSEESGSNESSQQDNPITNRLIKECSKKDIKGKIIAAIWCFSSVIHDHNENLKDAEGTLKTMYRDDPNYPPRENINLKGTVWSCFIQDYQDFMDTERENKLFNRNNRYDANCLMNFVYSDEKYPGGLGAGDVVGIGVDYGFRMTQCSDVGRLVIGKNLAAILHDPNEDRNDLRTGNSALYLGHEAKDPNANGEQRKGLFINYIGTRKFKGFPRLHPVYMAMRLAKENKGKHELIKKKTLKILNPKEELEKYTEHNDPQKYPREVPLMEVNEEWLKKVENNEKKVENNEKKVEKNNKD